LYDERENNRKGREGRKEFMIDDLRFTIGFDGHEQRDDSL